MRAMPDSPGPNLRLLAPVAVGVFAVALLIVLITSGALSGGASNESAGSASSSAERQRERSEGRRGRRERSTGSGSYKIQAGDTLGSIADDKEVSVERIQELNPQLDPQALSAGQRIRLRE
jgi:teichoic acid transport system ATP-binding protein